MRWLLVLVLALSVAACGSSDDRNGLTDEDLEGALLTLDDLPTGWSIEASDDEDDDDTDDGGGTRFCDTAPLSERIDADGSAEREFTGGQLGPLVSQLVASMNEDDAKAGMGFVREAFGCGDWVDPSTDVAWTISETPFPSLGDETVAYQLSADMGVVTASSNVVAVRDSGRILVMIHLAMGDLDSELTESLTRLALDKLVDI